ncbi:hypothetical protein Y5W_02786 [Alcanivorax sp. 521-1]|uniref:Thioredoxin domain-containing protein n=1 Tax=Alloalcanivorax profundimaris TaxID=2735259 RepID=A0ABS0ATN7_9GAMM|nr:redoxin domain-containing protein [Alloalcanivorax profundimaris]MBF5057492.1 hypothetical protein [Alloalcanivorax profundimaris]
MARLKALFIALYPVAALLICLHALGRWWPDGHWLWLGVVLVNAPILALLAWLLGRGPARTSPHLPAVTLCAWLGAAVTLLGTLALGDPRPLAWLYTALGLLGMCAYLFWYSPMQRDPARGPQPGRLLPPLSFRDLRGRLRSSGDLHGRPAVLLFFRGNWCPICMAQVRELARRRPQLERRGARIVLISAQPGKRTERLARRLGLELEWWLDDDLRAAAALDILDRGGTPLGLELFGYGPDTVLPTVLITDARGEIRYVDLADNYRVRPEPSVFLRVLDNMAPVPR